MGGELSFAVLDGWGLSARSAARASISQKFVAGARSGLLSHESKSKSGATTFRGLAGPAESCQEDIPLRGACMEGPH